MNKTAIKNFAVWARNKLIADITYKAGLIGVSEKGIAQPLPQSTDDLLFLDIGTKEYAKVEGKTAIAQRKALIDRIKSKESDMGYTRAYNVVIEEIAYTWFNRLIAIRFMEVNDYLPTRSRMLSSENPAKNEPDFVTSPFDTDVEFTDAEVQEIYRLKDDASKEASDELFRMLFIKMCNNLYEILPELFEKTNDYTEPLLSLSFADKDGIVYHLVHDIAEDDFNVEKEGQVEIIGWLYQYYISEKHDKVIDSIHNKTIKKEDIPAATQLFTTDWVVRYLVDNSLGRYWIERHPESNLADKLDFFVTPLDGKITYINEKIEPEELTFFDPCMGSGHILVYAFDVLMEIYREAGYTDRDAATSILENNLFGLDIDQRAYQLAYFAVMMKARSYNRRIFSKGVKCNVAVINESNGINKFTQANVTLDRKQNEIGEYIIDVFRHAKEIGSLQTVAAYDYDAFSAYVDSCEVAGQMDLFSAEWSMHTAPLVHKLVDQAKILSRKYTIVCTNPPYMNKIEGQLKKFVVDNYKAYSGDLFSVFMYRNFAFCAPNGYSAFMTPNVWMFIKTYEELRSYIVNQKYIVSLIQMAKGAFFKEATVDICAFVLSNRYKAEKGVYIRLEEFKGDMDVQKNKVLEAIEMPHCGYLYEYDQNNFEKIPGAPIAYWVSNNFVNSFNNRYIEELLLFRQGMATSNNNRFLRNWHEVNKDKIGFSMCSLDEAKESRKKWFPYNKGGEFRKWYGNNDLVVNWENDGEEMKAFTATLPQGMNVRLKSRDYYFKKGFTWSALSSGNISIRYSPVGFIFDIKGSMGFMYDNDNLPLIIGLLNSVVTMSFLEVLAPTLDFNPWSLKIIPFIPVHDKKIVTETVEECVELSTRDWNSFETSWDFEEHPIVKYSKELWDATAIGAAMQRYYNGHPKVSCPLELCFLLWQGECNERFSSLKQNEEKLNRIFIDSYGLNGELDPEVNDKDVTVRKADINRDIRSLISYAVGCMFGRYSLDSSGLVCTEPSLQEDAYVSYRPDKDNCIPITEEEYLEDDIVGRFCEWLKVVFGADTLEANLTYVAKALGNKGATSREVIRNYFLNDFIKDHIKLYQKRPIYWLFDSGKQNGFKALVYMHRWNADTVGNLRVEYLHKMQHTYERVIVRMQEAIDNSRDSREVSKATKRKDKLQKQLKETKDYDTKLAHIALSRIEIDLDDGVKVNYEKVQTGRDGKKMQILAKI